MLCFVVMIKERVPAFDGNREKAYSSFRDRHGF
jgi:hypothetical protein